MKRETQQRDAIREALATAARPLSVNEILDTAQKRVARLGIATVYRNLRELQKESMVVPVDVPGQSTRWEIAPDAHHHHFLCQRCDKMFEIPGCPEGITNLLPAGYTLSQHELLLRGHCDACSARQRNVRRKAAQD